MSKDNFDYAKKIWDIAEYTRDTINRKDFDKVILPFTLLRRLECALEDTKDDVVKKYDEMVAKKKEKEYDFTRESKKPFYNYSKYSLKTIPITGTWSTLKAYIDSFSDNAKEIMEKFKMADTCTTLENEGMLYEVCQRFAKFNLSPDNVSDREMSDIYEHLIERYGEEIAEDAEDFMTPKDVVRLAVKMVFANDDELLNSDNGAIRTLYDPTLGTSGFICDALDLLDEWHANKEMVAPATIIPYGQECEAESWAIGKSNLLIRNISSNSDDEFNNTLDLSEHIVLGDTLIDPAFKDMKFNYILSNPPYGKKWEKQKDAVNKEAKMGYDGRFGAGVPKITDGAMLFLQHVVSKMAPAEQGGGKAAVVLAGSPLFNGDPGQGESNIRRWLFQIDVVDCIVKLPSDLFFRTGINTYLWILNNCKDTHRKGKIQLIDASEMYVPRKKTLGKKRVDISEDQMNWICKTYVDGHDHGNSVHVPVEEFMYRRVTIQRPLRLCLNFTDNEGDFASLMQCTGLKTLNEHNRATLRESIFELAGQHIHYNGLYPLVVALRDDFEKQAKLVNNKQLSDALVSVYGEKSSDYDICTDNKGNPIPDPDLKDFEDIPYLDNISDYMKREVLPYTSDAWVDESITDSGSKMAGMGDDKVGLVGTNISFNNYFYHYEAPRNPDTIATEILELENGLESFMEAFLK